MRKLIAVLMIASQFVLWGCAFEGAEYTEESDLVLTNYDNTFDFAGKATYSLPSQIVKITGDPTAPPEYIKDIYGIPILAEIEANMAALGWTKVDVNASPDLQLLPAAWTTTTIVYGGYWGGYYCWYWPYYCGGGGWYYPYSPVSSYSSGTMVMTMVNPNQESTDGSLGLVWTSAMNGLLSGTYEIDRLKKGINQAFAQSPYLKTN